MNKIELEISDIAPSGSTSGAYALVRSEVGANRKLPIVIGGHEAQAIAIELEKMTPSRPLTHDLFKSFSHSFGIDVEEVIIYNLIEGIFFAKLIANLDGRKAEIDSRTSDAVALAVASVTAMANTALTEAVTIRSSGFTLVETENSPRLTSTVRR